MVRRMWRFKTIIIIGALSTALLGQTFAPLMPQLPQLGVVYAQGTQEEIDPVEAYIELQTIEQYKRNYQSNMREARYMVLKALFERVSDHAEGASEADYEQYAQELADYME